MINPLKPLLLSRMWAALLLLVLSSSATAHVSHGLPGTKSLPWTLSLSEDNPPLSVTPGMTKVVVFRLDNEKEIFKYEPLNIFVDGQYHASLLPENRTAVFTLCPGAHQIAVKLGQHGKPPEQPKKEKTESFKTAPDTILLYQVTANQQGEAIGRWVKEDKYKNAIMNLPRQAHTLSRVIQHSNCNIETFTINGSALFDFNASDIAGLRPEGRRAIEEIISSLNQNYKSVEHITIKGYTDPVGFPQYNQKLSEARAKTVAHIFEQAHIGSATISYSGMGARNPLVVNCSNQYENIAVINACNQPNRRVEIAVLGIKKAISANGAAKASN